jgi:catechol 2,3-dioxygenase-like lactoylglutathione lyase family enzyme
LKFAFSLDAVKKSRHRALPAAHALKMQKTVIPFLKIRRRRLMQLGAFSISLAVKDIEASKVFYEKLGFTVFGGDQTQNWLIMKNGDHLIGLFQGMFDKNILTFNPGWDHDAKKLESFTDVRDLQRQLKARGLSLLTEADENSAGPASFTVVDPDGNMILVDQHV